MPRPWWRKRAAWSTPGSRERGRPGENAALFGAAWLYGESVAHVDTTIVWTVSGPIILALFVGHQLGATADAAQQAANQTNGVLGDRIKAAVAAALADRDAARTRQAQGDIGPDQAAASTTDRKSDTSTAT